MNEQPQVPQMESPSPAASPMVTGGDLYVSLDATKVREEMRFRGMKASTVITETGVSMGEFYRYMRATSEKKVFMRQQRAERFARLFGLRVENLANEILTADEFAQRRHENISRAIRAAQARARARRARGVRVPSPKQKTVSRLGQRNMRSPLGILRRVNHSDIRKAFFASGRSLKDVARASGIPYSSLCKYVSAKVGYRAERMAEVHAQALAKTLKVDVSKIVSGKVRFMKRVAVVPAHAKAAPKMAGRQARANHEVASFVSARELVKLIGPGAQVIVVIVPKRG